MDKSMDKFNMVPLSMEDEQIVISEPSHVILTILNTNVFKVLKIHEILKICILKVSCPTVFNTGTPANVSSQCWHLL